MAGELVLITGVSSFLGFATTVATLESGYRVRGVVRKTSQIDEIKSALPAELLNQIEFIVIPDLTVAGVFNEPAKDVDHIIHVASPANIETDNYKRDYLLTSRDITLAVLTGASNATAVKRVVITSSLSPYVPISEFVTGKFSREVFRSDDEINHYTVDDEFQVRLFAYAASKSIALDTADAYIKEHKPSYSVVYIAPSFVFGPNKLAKTVEDFNKGSNAFLLNHILGKSKDPLLTLSVHIDDVAKAHVLSLKESVPPGRYILDSEGPGHTNWADAVPFVKKYYPEAVGKVFDGDAKPFAVPIKLDNSKAEKAFGIKFKSFEEQVKDTAGYYLSLLKE